MKLTAFLVHASLLALALALFGGLVLFVDAMSAVSPVTTPAEAPQRWVQVQQVITTPTSTSTTTRTPTWTSTTVSTDTATATHTPTSVSTDTATATHTSTATHSATATGSPTQTSTVTATPILPPAICVSAFDDQDGDGQRQPGESLLAGALITVTNDIEIFIGAITTNDVMSSCFTSLLTGNYFVREQDPPGYQSTTPNTVGVTLNAGDVADLKFGDRLGPTPTSTGSPTASPTRTSTATPSATFSPSSTPTATATSTEIPTATETATATNSATATLTITPTATRTTTTTLTPTSTATETPTTAGTLTPTATTTPTPTATPTTTRTPTPTATATATPSLTATTTSTPTPAWTPTATGTPGPLAWRAYLPLILHFKFIPPTSTPTPTPTTVSCTETIINGGFEETEGWIFGSTPRPGRYSSEEAYLGNRSVLLGIKPPQSDAYSWSSVRQQITIPANADVASLSFWYKPFTEETPAISHQPLAIGYQLPVVSHSDWHEALILDDQFPSPTVLDVLMRLRSNSQTWSRQTHDLTAYAGQTINVYFNALNNGQGGLRTWMYLDEVSLMICTKLS